MCDAYGCWSERVRDIFEECADVNVVVVFFVEWGRGNVCFYEE